MGDIVAFKERGDEGREDLNFLLPRAIEIGKKVTGKICNGVLVPGGSLSELLESKFNQVLLKENMIDSEIFRCAIYAARLFEKFGKETPESYYGTDYFVRGWQEGEPMFFKKGGDACCLVCTFFDGFAKRRTSLDDFQRMGIYLYSLYYARTKDTMGWCMSNNFKSIVAVAKEGISLL